MDPMGYVFEIVPIELGSIISVYPRPRIPEPKNGSCQPGGDWDPGWGGSSKV